MLEKKGPGMPPSLAPVGVELASASCLVYRGGAAADRRANQCTLFASDDAADTGASAADPPTMHRGLTHQRSGCTSSSSTTTSRGTVVVVVARLAVCRVVVARRAFAVVTTTGGAATGRSAVE